MPPTKDVTLKIPNVNPFELMCDVLFTAGCAVVGFVIAVSLLPAPFMLGGIAPFLAAALPGWFAWKWARTTLWFRPK